MLAKRVGAGAMNFDIPIYGICLQNFFLDEYIISYI